MKYKQIYKSQNEAMEKRYEQLKAKNNLLREDDYVDGKSFCCSKQIDGMYNDLSSDGESNPQKEQNIYFYHPDHLGSTNVVTDYDGRASRVISYIPYGEIFMEQQSGGWQSPYLFNSKELDSETGLYYYGARYLDPTSAAWLSVDPLFEKYVGISPYGYCAGNPVRLVDVDGEKIKIGNIVYVPGKARIEMGKTPFEKNAILALNYLYNGKSEKVKGVIEKLCNTERYNITIQKSNESRVVLPYTETEQVLEWNDLGAIETDNGVKLSPANGLFHEMGHLDLHLDLINAEESGDSNAMESAMEREFPEHEPVFGPSYDIHPHVPLSFGL